MEALSRRRPRRRRWTPALLLAVVALTLLVVASPAVARPAHFTPPANAALSAAGTIAVIAVAVCVALALVLLAFVMGRGAVSSQGAAIPKPQRVRRHTRHGVTV